MRQNAVVDVGQLFPELEERLALVDREVVIAERVLRLAQRLGTRSEEIDGLAANTLAVFNKVMAD